MGIVQLLLVGGGLFALIVLLYLAFAGKSPGKESHRRMQAVRYRHSDNAVDKVESQLKKAIAARKPKMHRVAGASSRREALAIRLMRTGKNWTVSQYLYATLGLTLALAAILYLRTGAIFLSAGIGLMFGAGIPHFLVGYFIKRRTNRFNATAR